MTVWKSVGAKWLSVKPYLFALAIGLVVGPFFSSYMGWQVTSGTARAELRAGVLNVQASNCEARARMEVKDTSKLDWNARTDLAKKWAPLPGADTADSDIARACADKLASAS